MQQFVEQLLLAHSSEHKVQSLFCLDCFMWLICDLRSLISVQRKDGITNVRFKTPNDHIKVGSRTCMSFGKRAIYILVFVRNAHGHKSVKATIVRSTNVFFVGHLSSVLSSFFLLFSFGCLFN